MILTTILITTNNKDMESIGNLIWEFENGSISAYKLIEKLKEINDNINNY